MGNKNTVYLTEEGRICTTQSRLPLVGFIDMFIPALITSPTLPLETRFVIASLSLVQIIYLTEVGSIIVKSGVGLNIPKLFVIFVERTLIALPLIVLVAKYCL